MVTFVHSSRNNEENKVIEKVTDFTIQNHSLNAPCGSFFLSKCTGHNSSGWLDHCYKKLEQGFTAYNDWINGSKHYYNIDFKINGNIYDINQLNDCFDIKFDCKILVINTVDDLIKWINTYGKLNDNEQYINNMHNQMNIIINKIQIYSDFLDKQHEKIHHDQIMSLIDAESNNTIEIINGNVHIPKTGKTQKFFARIYVNLKKAYDELSLINKNMRDALYYHETHSTIDYKKISEKYDGIYFTDNLQKNSFKLIQKVGDGSLKLFLNFIACDTMAIWNANEYFE